MSEYAINDKVVKSEAPTIIRRLVPNGAIGIVKWIYSDDHLAIWYPDYGYGEDTHPNEIKPYSE